MDVPEHFEIFRQILRQGGERGSSQLRIISHFAKERSREENTAFVRREFDEGYRGYVFPEGQIAVGYGPEDIFIGWGDSVIKNNASAAYPWDFVAITLSNMLHRGEFLPQNILDQAFDNEVREAAETFIFLHREIANGTVLVGEGVITGGFPESTANVMALLKDPAAHAEIVTALDLFAAEYAQNRDVLRSQYYKPEDVLRQIEDVQAPHTRFETAPDFTYRPQQKFISQDEVDVVLWRDHIQDGKLAIFDYFSQPHTPQEQAAFLKNLYGWGGSYGDGVNKTFDGKGIHISRGRLMEPDTQVFLSWAMAAKRIPQLIAADRYLTPAEKERLPAYLAQLAERRQPAQEPEPSEEVTPMEFRYAVGDQVYLGAQGYEIAAVGESTVSLYNPRFPLLNEEFTWDEFERRMWQDARNDHLKVPVEEAPVLTPDTPRILYKQYLPLLLDDLRRSEIYSYLRDSDSYAEVAHELVYDWVFTASLDKEAYPGLTEALGLPEFQNWLAEDLFQNTYQDVVVDGGNQLLQYQVRPDAPEWAQLPPMDEQICEDLYLRGFVVSEELVKTGIAEHHAQNSSKVVNYYDIVDFIQNEYLTEEPAHEAEQPLDPEAEIPERTERDSFNEYAVMFIRKVYDDEPYRNARTNSDEQNARLECDAAVDRIMQSVGVDNLELYKLFYDTPGFRERMQAHVFKRTYTDTQREIARILKPARTRKTIEQSNYEFLNQLAPEIFSGEATYLRLTAGAGMMPLHINQVRGNRISVHHQYEQNGDMMADPDMTFVFDREVGSLAARTFQQDGLGVFQQVEDDGGRINTALERKLNSFARGWFKNIRNQGYRREVMELSYRDDALELVYGEDGSIQFINGEVTRAAAYARAHGIVLPAEKKPLQRRSFSPATRNGANPLPTIMPRSTPANPPMI
jgi:hypothetical protein